MAKITNFVFCEDEGFQNRNDSFEPLEIVEVTQQTFALNIILSVCDYVVYNENFCNIIIKDAQENEIFSTGNFPVPNETQGSVDLERMFTGFTLGVTFNNLPYRGNGLYSVSVIFNNTEEMGIFYIPVTFIEGGE